MFRKRIVGNGVNYFTNNIYDHSPAISDDDYIGPHTDDFEVYVPRLTKKETTIDSKTYTTEYLAFDSYSQPISISETGDALRTIARTYWYNPSLNIVDRLASETITYGSSVFPTNYSYNSNGTIQSKNVAGVITSYTYHRNNGNLRRVTDASGRWIENTEYEYGVPKTINKGNVYSITRVINWEGTIASETNGRAQTTNFWYDSRSRLIRIIPPIGDPTIIEYLYGGERPFSVYKKISFGPAWTKYRFDHWGNINFSQSSWHNIMTDYTYDALDRKTFESYPYVTTRLGDTLTYDGLDRTKRITHPDNAYIEYIYNQSKVTLRNELGKNTEFQYIAFGNLAGDNLLASVKDALNQTTNYIYDAANQITSLNAAGGYNRTYHYNTKYLLDYEITPECGQTNYVYDNAGNLIQKTDANGNSISFGYDNATRLTNEHYNGVAYSSFFYDDADNCSLYTTPTSACSLYYDELNRVIRKTLIIDNSSYAVSFLYDSRGNVERITYPDDSYVVYQYLQNNWVSVVVDYTNGILYHPSGKELSYYTNNGRGTHFEYNERYRTTKITVDGNVQEEGYQYDYLGNLINYTDYLNSANNQTFTYDDIDRLKTFNGPWGSGTYNYTSGYAISRRSQEIIGSNTTNYYYDITNHRLSSTTGANPYTFTYDNIGNLTGITNQMALVYNIENRPISINKFLGTTTYFVYDAKGIRIKKELGIPPPLNLEGESVTTPTDIYYYLTGLNGEVLCEIQPTVPDKTFDNYIYLNGKKLCRKRGPNKYFYHCDFLGNTKAMTDNAGTKIYSWLDYPFGKQYSMTGGSYNNYRFTGKELDASTGFYYFGARYYMPEIGRFITPDPSGKFEKKDPKMINLFAYCTDNPTRYVDRTDKWRTYANKTITYVTRQSVWGSAVETGVSFVPGMDLGICLARSSQKDITLSTTDWIVAGLDIVPVIGKALGIGGKFAKIAFKTIETVGQAAAVYQGLSEIEKSIVDKEIFNRLKEAGFEVYRSNSNEELLVLGNNEKEFLLNVGILRDITTEVMHEREERLKSSPCQDRGEFYPE